MRDVATLDASPAEISGLGEVGHYTIQADAAMFRILIDGLYSDKPRAVVRELCTNARDSHAEAGILDRPFVLQLPGRFDDTFRVRDFGVSLTHDDVMRLYTTVGRSTKRDSNTSVGKFGLGSKVPFACTDSFTITAILEGEKRIYNAFMDAGAPKIALLVQEPTDEEQGLEVSFPVRQGDHEAFTRAARRVLLGFDVIPENNAGINKPELTILFEGDDWKMFESDSHMQGAYVRQGCVLYPIDTQVLTSGGGASRSAYFLSQECILLDMPIGSVDITPSRESLSYDATTVANLCAKFESIIDDVTLKMMLAIEGAPTFHGAMKARKELLGSISSGALREHLSKALYWHGRKINDIIRLSPEMFGVLARRGVVWRELARQGSRRSKKWGTRSLTYTTIDPCKPLRFYYTPPSEPHPRYFSQRITEAVQGKHGEHILIGFEPGSKAEMYLRVALGRPEEELEFINLLDFSYTKPNYQKAAAYYTVFSSENDKFCKNSFRSDVDIYYVCTRRNTAQRDGSDVSDHMVGRIWRALKDTGLLSEDAVLVGIPVSRKDLIRDIEEEWESFFAVAEDLVREKFKPEIAAQVSLATDLRRKYRNNIWTNLIARIQEKQAEITDGDSFFIQAAGSLMFYLRPLPDENLQSSLQELIPVIFSREQQDELLVQFDIQACKQQFEAHEAALQASYPLLTFLVAECRWDFTTDLKFDTSVMIDYINMVDHHHQENALAEAFCG